jgi:hypothetical protein
VPALQLNVLYTTSYQENNVQVLADLPTVRSENWSEVGKNQIGVENTPSSRSRAAQKSFCCKIKGKVSSMKYSKMHIHV